MEYRVGELASAAGIGVDTVRFYQSRGLIDPPERRGRYAIYDERHLERIRRIRGWLEEGFSLAQIRRLLDHEESVQPPPRQAGVPAADRPAPGDRGLLEALADQSVAGGTLTRAELAAETGVPEALVASVVEAGLIRPLSIRGEERFPRSDRELVRGALEILGMGLPLDRLLELAALHVRGVDLLAEQAIDLFDEHVRKPGAPDPDGVRRVFERLLPRVTEIVALHFQRTVVTRALARLRGRGEESALEAALEATRDARLEVQWR